MYYFIYPEVDTTLYQASGSINTGLDEILEIKKDMKSDGSSVKVSRILMKFDLNEVSKSIVSGQIATDAKFYLNLYDANPSDLSYSQSLWAYPVSQSWVSGEGKFHDNPRTGEGASWYYKDGSAARTQWDTAITSSGATWYTASYGSQSFAWGTTDMRMNVTPIVNKWLDRTYPNEGFMLKRSGSVGNSDVNVDEGSKDRLGSFSFFSRETNTIYPPKLEVEWYDTAWNTGSLSALSSAELEDLSFYMKGLRPVYKEKSKIKFRLVGRAKYPTKSYSNTASEYLTAKYLPSGSKGSIGGDGTYYSVKDALTEDVIIPFGTGSLASCDSTGNYFHLWMNGMQPERFYEFSFKVVSGSNTAGETVQYFEDGFTFKIER